MSEHFDKITKHPLFEAWGLRIEERAPGKVVIFLPAVRPEHLGGGGTDALNGMVIAAMFDAALAGAVLSWLVARAEEKGASTTAIRQATINLDISYLRLATGSSFETHARVLRVGSDIAFVEGKLFDKGKRLCATASGSFFLFHNNRAQNERKEHGDSRVTKA